MMPPQPSKGFLAALEAFKNLGWHMASRPLDRVSGGRGKEAGTTSRSVVPGAFATFTEFT